MKIAVLGSAGSSVHRAPFKNAQYETYAQGRSEPIMRAHDSVPGEWDIWGCSPGCWAVAPRATRWFEIHRWEINVPWFSPEYVQFLRTFKGPVYTGGQVPEIPTHEVYPIDRLEARFSSYFMTSTLALMMAMAIDTIEQIRKARRKSVEAYGAEPGMPPEDRASAVELLPLHVSATELDKPDSDDVIGLWGVDMAAADEYAYQRPGCQFFVLEAMRRGIGVYLPPESDLMRPQPVYGISEWDHNYIKLTSRSREINGGIAEIAKDIAEKSQRSAGMQGEAHALQAFVSTWCSPYGMLPGMVIRQDGEDLGSGITSVDMRPVARMNITPALQAMTEAPGVALGREVMAALEHHMGETGLSENLPEVAKRLGQEGKVGRELSTLLQDFVHRGEGTREALVRVIEAAVGNIKPKKAKKKKK